MEELVGKIKSITYSDRSTGFYILKISNETGKDTTVKGSFYDVSVSTGLKVKFLGTWVDHEKFGRQFDAHRCEIMQEKGRNGVINYLISHVPSIGPITASKLYVEFGDDLLDVLTNSPEKINDVGFLTSTQKESILAEWKQSSMMRTVAIILSDLGLNASQIKTIYKKWGVETKNILNDNPYRLTECEGIGFTTADNVARRFGIEPDDVKRITAITLAIMRDLCNSDGHTYLSSSEIQKHSIKFFKRHNIEPFSNGPQLSDITFFQGLKSLRDSGHVISDDDKLYLKSHWDSESYSAECVAKMILNGPRNFGSLDEHLNEFKQEKGLTLASEQTEAYMLLNNSNIIVVSGYPGTGKTTLIGAFVHLFEKNNINYSLMSPTGIAAKRISQATGRPAATIHRSLGYKGEEGWTFNRFNKFRVDAVILDETSMCDSSTFCHLISSLLPTTTLILVGDSAQLPSVGAGYVLNNLLNSIVPHVFLKRIFRQEKQSDIITIAHQIQSGDRVDTAFKKDSDFLFLPFKNEDVVSELCKITSKMKDKNCDFQVISPMYDGLLGVDNLNRELRKFLNEDYVDGKTSSIRSGSTEWHEGDRVMVTKNNYDKMVFNGDVGKIQRISIKDDEVEIKIFDWFDQESPYPRYVDKVFTYKVEEVKRNFRVAYACTVHRCQGNSFDYVILPMTTEYGIMLYRNLIYTAITRARKKVFIFGSELAFYLSTENNREVSRNSNLNNLIERYYNSLVSDLENQPDEDPTDPRRFPMTE